MLWEAMFCSDDSFSNSKNSLVQEMDPKGKKNLQEMFCMFALGQVPVGRPTTPTQKVPHKQNSRLWLQIISKLVQVVDGCVLDLFFFMWFSHSQQSALEEQLLLCSSEKNKKQNSPSTAMWKERQQSSSLYYQKMKLN